MDRALKSKSEIDWKLPIPQSFKGIIIIKQPDNNYIIRK